MTNPRLMGLTIEDVQVGSWCPTADGTGPAQAVALNIKVRWNRRTRIDMVLRLKSPQAVDELIAALNKHKADVWPNAS
jgi:hypothetical protein